MNKKMSMYFVINNALSELVYHIFIFAIPIYIFMQTQSPLAMSSFRALQLLPNVLLGLFIGLVIDRINKQKVLFFSVFIQFVLFVFLYGLYKMELFSLLNVYVITFVLYSLVLLFDQANYAMIPFVIEREELSKVNSAISMSDTAISLLGPAIAGVIIAIVGMEGMFWIIGLLFIMLFIPVLSLKKADFRKQKVDEPKRQLKEDLFLGFSYLKKENKELLNFTILILLVNIAISFSSAILMYFSLQQLKMNSQSLGLLLSVASIGGIVGSIFFKKINQFFRNGIRTILFCLIILCGSQLVLFFSWHSFTLMIGLFLTNLSVFVLNIFYSTYRHAYTPEHIMGRVTAATSMIMKLSAPLSFISAGILAEAINIKLIFLISALILFLLVMRYSRKHIQPI
ncbi:hypothetical protein ABD83_03165 [Bacillus xiamenensis]|uniref:MFS transporter n=1 Tax=Bacillus xiamenensis TaxID=1178537 RepID=A0ABT4F654_9BACI|nr:MFS transporter [Bacillus xiamenensis]MBG9910485.1 hypothetical protein [Bacillus xiamenensis]MCY9576970.1 MFS transporter [Bacillus xiamenensis]